MKLTIKNRIRDIRQGRVPKGYKRCSIGIIPEDWLDIPLDRLGSLKNGLNYHLANPGYACRVLGVGDFRHFSIMRRMDTLEVVSLKERPNHDLSLKDGDIVFVRSNGSPELVGRHLLVYPGSLPVFYSGFCICYRMFKSALTDPEYVNCVLAGGILKRKLERENQGSSIRNLNQSLLQNLIIPIPVSLKQQRKIAKILATQDKVIELRAAILKEKQYLKKYLMHEFLTENRRLPGFGQSWRKIKLADILSERVEKNDGQTHRICSVSVHKGVVDQVEHLGRVFAATDTSNYGVAHYGDLIYTKSPTGDFPYGIIKQSQLKEAVAVSPLYGVYQPSSYELGYLLQTYFSYAANCANYLRPIVHLGPKHTINITNRDFLSNQLNLPMCREEQQKLATVFISIDKEINLIQQIIEQEKLKKKALMQLLLTGIVRV